jgi:Ca2+-binding EF-hand superfamily protein
MVVGDKMDNIANLKLTKNKFRLYLQSKFGSAIAEKACLTLDFTVPMDFATYCKQLEQLVGERKLLLQLAFDVFDSNNDGMVSELDLFKLLFQFNKQNLDFVSCI